MAPISPLAAAIAMPTLILVFSSTGNYLTNNELRAIAPCRFSGIYYEREPSMAPPARIAGELAENGVFFMTWNGGRWPTGSFDKAKWWIDGDRWCRRFNVLSGGRSRCYSVKRNNLGLVFETSAGRKAFSIQCQPGLS